MAKRNVKNTGMTDEQRAEKQRMDEQMKRLRELRQSRNEKIKGMQQKSHQNTMRKKMMSKGGEVDVQVANEFFTNNGIGEKYVTNKKFDEALFRKNMEARLNKSRSESLIKMWSRELGMNPSKYINGEIIENIDFVNDSTKRAKHLFSLMSKKMETGGGVGKKGRYHILGELEGKQPLLYSATDDKNDISKLVKLADKDFFDLTGKKHKIFVTDSVTDEEIYHYGNGGGVPIFKQTDVEDLRLLIAENYDHEVDGDGHDVAKAFNRYRRGSKAKYDPSTDTITYIIDYEEKDDKMETGGSMDDYTKNLARVKVKFANPKYNYETSVSGDITEEEARKYFVGQVFDMGVYPKENMQKVTDIEFFAKGTYEQGGGVNSKKVYYQMSGVGTSKYVVNFHDGKKTHKDGSPFFDIEIFKNKVDLKKFIDKLHEEGYVESHEHGGKMAFGGMVNDLPEHVIERMDGLVLNDELDRFLYATEAIVKDMENEGFEKDETLSFLASKMVQAAKDMYKTGGYVKGDDIVFNRYDKSTEGTIHEKLDDGNFVVYTDNGVILVEPRDITGRGKKRLFGIFENGGNVAKGAAHIYVVLENGDIKVYHGDDRKSLLFEKRNAPEGSWEKIWECLRKL